jgi:hypothetical protein
MICNKIATRITKTLCAMNFKFTIILIFISVILHSQNFVTKANKLYKKGDMYGASPMYGKAIENEKFSEIDEILQGEIYYNYANALRLTLDFDEALKIY